MLPLMTIHQPLVRLSENGETLPGGRVRAPLPLPSDGEQKSSAMPLTTPPCILLGLRRNSKDHTAEEWEGIRPRFTELYLSKGMRLADVSQILRDHHGFHATDKQYKDRIRKWKIRKNFNGNLSTVLHLYTRHQSLSLLLVPEVFANFPFPDPILILLVSRVKAVMIP